ncbi:MAG TPA: DUF116 domain-containing protein [Candidatus Cloacimonadota bacterium]|nr:DUF116 domain-containing protein [Candidatus Cloacimonadota bacterium]
MKEYYFAVIKFPVFVSLSLIILIGLFMGLALGTTGRTGLSTSESIFYGVVFTILVLMVLSWFLILFSTHHIIRPQWLKSYLQWMLCGAFYYLAKGFAYITFRKREGLQESFLNFNNEVVISNFTRIQNPRLLVLLPHCLQSSECKIRITNDINDCADCGRCNVTDIKKSLAPYPVKLAVATGGSLARKLIIDNRPDIIIAVACHRDLTEGVRDSWRFPVYAILNERPNGPCFETTVNIKAIEFAIKKFL